MPRFRDNKVEVRLSDKEYAKFEKNVEKSGVSKSAYLRHLINGYVPRECPPIDYFDMMNALYNNGNNINQLTRIAHITRSIHEDALEKTLKEYNRLLGAISERMILPEKIE